MRSLEQSAHQIIRQRIRAKLVADVASRVNGPVDGLFVLVGKGRRPDEELVRSVVHRNPHNAQPPAVHAGKVYLARPVF